VLPNGPLSIDSDEDHGISTRSVVLLAKNHVSCRFGEEFAILNLTSCTYYGLEQCAAHVWGLLKGGRSWTVAELRDSILEKYEAEAERIERDLIELLGEMRASGLMEVGEARTTLPISKKNIPLVQKGATAGTGARPPSSKKLYLKPNLTTYGTIRELTQVNATKGNNDGRGSFYTTPGAPGG
jgi:hypothetical protein